jgi:hypothetical protein
VWAVVLFTFLSTMLAHADSKQNYLDALVDFERYAETIWHDAAGTSRPTNGGYWGDGGSSGNGGIRGSCGVAVAYAVLVVAQPNDPKVARRISRVTKALNYAGQAHTTGTKTCVDNQKWGWSSPSSTDWQTPEWSSSMALACILVQSNLPAQTIADCQRVVASEATHRASIPPASGHVGDTKAEENAWDSNILAVGAAWMNTNSNAAVWLNAAKQYLANSYTVANTSRDPLARWISTVTLYPSYALENHGMFHPTYEMVTGMSLGDSLLMARLANPAIAGQLQPFAEHNVLCVWSNVLSSMLFDSGEFAYPAGLDWELHDYEQDSYLAWLASHFDDPQARWADAHLAQLVRTRQMLNENGEFVGASGGGFYREAVEARRTAISWLHWANADHPNGPAASPPPVFKHLPDVGVMVHRSAYGFTSLSYGPRTNGSGARIMAMIEPAVASFPSNVFVTSPLLPGGIGTGALGKPTGARLVSLITNAIGFQAELQVTNGANGTTEVYFKSTGETVGVVEIPFPANSFVGGSAASFHIGIENDPLTGGSRLLEWTGTPLSVSNRSGTARNITNNWICVSERYGLAAGPAGYFNYQAASSHNRLGAAEDTLKFFPNNSLGARYAVWFPSKNASQTASNTSLIKWSVTASNSMLTFPGPTGSVSQIIAALPRGNRILSGAPSANN